MTKFMKKLVLGLARRLSTKHLILLSLLSDVKNLVYGSWEIRHITVSNQDVGQLYKHQSPVHYIYGIMYTLKVYGRSI